MKLFLLLTVSALSIGMPMHASDGDKFSVNNFNYTILSESAHTVEISGWIEEPEGELYIPSSVNHDNTDYAVIKIGNSAFRFCSQLSAVNIPSPITTIGERAFEFCSLSTVDIANSVTTIEAHAFDGCAKLSSITIPASVTSIGEFAFSGCVTMDKILVEEDNSAFSSVDGALFNYDKTTIIACPGGKTTYSIPNSVSKIGEYAFYFCTKLESVNIPNSVITIGEGAFYLCQYLSTITIPYQVTTIGDKAFGGCNFLRTIFACPTTPPTIDYDTFDIYIFDRILYIPRGSLEKYIEAEGWHMFAVEDFRTEFREMGAINITLSEEQLYMNIGESYTITASVAKDEDMTFDSESWTSSNPEVATVDNGIITAIADGISTITYSVVDGYGILHDEECAVTVGAASTIETISTDTTSSEPEYYTVNGMRVSPKNITPGLYIIRQNNRTKKMLVK